MGLIYHRPSGENFSSALFATNQAVFFHIQIGVVREIEANAQVCDEANRQLN